MTHQVIARNLLIVLCAVQGLTALAVNLNYNHARASRWAGHARFHVVWQTGVLVSLALVELVLLLAGGSSAEQRFYLAALLAAIPMFGFFLAFLGRSLYGGTIADGHGMPPAHMRVFRASFFIDLNVAAEIVAALALVLIVLLYRHSGMAH